MTINLAPEVESWIHQEAQRYGISPETFVAQRLRQPYPASPHAAEALETLDEGALLTKINEGFPAAFWSRYRTLIMQRNAGSLHPDEQTELLELSDQVERKTAERAPYLIALARLRGVSLPDLVRDLGLRPTPVDG